MQNPFDILLERFNGLEEKLSNISIGNSFTTAEIINRDELCKRLDITEPTCIRWEKKGKIPRIEIGSAIRYNWPKVIEALESKKGGR
jgi:predicted DNA-binding transcriptional regulator AlpA